MVHPYSIILFLINTVYLILPNNKIIHTNVYQVYYYNKLSIHLGTPSILYEIGFDINSEHNWLCKQDNNYTSSSMSIIEENIQMTIDNIIYKGTKIEDTMFFDDNPDKPVRFRFNLLHLEKQRVYNSVKGVITFPFRFNDEKTSILHQLKQKDVIEHLSFAYIKQEYKAELFLGGLPPVYLKNRHHSYCDVIESSSKWACLISGIILRNKTKERQYKNTIETDIAYLDTMSHKVFVPKAVFDFLIENYYTESIESNICQIRNSTEGRYLSCFDEYLYKMGNITFILGGFAFEIKLENFFLCAEEFCHYLIQEHCSNNWRLGSKFFEMYNTLFDYEEKRIHFYSINKLDNAPYILDINASENKFKKKLVLGLVIFITIIGAIILVFIKKESK